MPYAIDEEKLDSPNMKILDINQPPLRSISYQEFPKMVYLHPVDKTREHRYKIVQDRDELEAAQKQGWKTKPHIQLPPPDPAIAAGEFEVAPEVLEAAKQETRRSRRSEVA